MTRLIAVIPGATRAGILLALMTAPACYGYVAVDPATEPPAGDVRVVLSSVAADRLSPTAVPSQTVMGDLVALTEDSVAVSVWIGSAYRGTPFEPVHQTITIPRQNVVRFERRQLSRWRTALSAIGIIAAVVVLVDQTVFQDNPNPPDDGGPPPPPPITSGRLRSAGYPW